MTNKSDYIQIKTDYILKALHFIAWIIFVGLSIDAAGYLTNTVATLAFKPDLAAGFWNKLDLSNLYRHSQSQFVTLTVLMSIATTLKALMFGFIVKKFYDKNLNISKPFNETLSRFVIALSYFALGIGMFSLWGRKLVESLTSQGVTLPYVHRLGFGGGDVWMFMGITLLVIAFILKKGIEIQNEIDLTV